MIDYYKILNVPQDASQDLIRKAFRKSAKHTHPDLFPDDSPAEKKKTMLLNLRNIFGRMELSNKELRILSSVFSKL